LEAYDFDTTLGASPTLLSYDVGAGQTLEELLFWRMPEGGSQWNPFTPDHSSLSGDLVSFSVDGSAVTR
jgi:hypothetical protein